MIKKIFLTLLISILVNQNVFAVTLSEALLQAYISNPELNAERENIQVSKEDLNISRSEFLPVVTLSGSQSEENTKKLTDRTGTNSSYTDVSTKTQSIKIEQKLFQGFAGIASIEKSKIGLSLADAKLLKTEQKILYEILNSNFKDKCFALDNLQINEILPIIKNCNIAICNDSSFSHLSSGLGVKTIVLISDTPLLYGNYSPRMYPIIPDGKDIVTHDTHGKDQINPNKIFKQLNNILD